MSYAEGIRRIDANPHLLAKDANLFDAKWNVVACSLDIGDGFVEASKLIVTEPRFFLDENLEMSLMTAMRLWADGHIHECGSILDKLDAIEGINGKLAEAGLEPAMFEKLKLWVSERRRLGA